jgi:hypothetical protein
MSARNLDYSTFVDNLQPKVVNNDHSSVVIDQQPLNRSISLDSLQTTSLVLAPDQNVAENGQNGAQHPQTTRYMGILLLKLNAREKEHSTL